MNETSEIRDETIETLFEKYFSSMIMDQFQKYKQPKKSKLPEIFDFVLFCINTYSGQTIYLFLKGFIDARTQEDATGFSKSCNDHFRNTNKNFRTIDFFTKLYNQRLMNQGEPVSNFKKQFFSSNNEHFQRYKKLQPSMLDFCYKLLCCFESKKSMLQKQTETPLQTNSSVPTGDFEVPAPVKSKEVENIDPDFGDNIDIDFGDNFDTDFDAF